MLVRVGATVPSPAAELFERSFSRSISFFEQQQSALYSHREPSAKNGPSHSPRASVIAFPFKLAILQWLDGSKILCFRFSIAISLCTMQKNASSALQLARKLDQYVEVRA